MSEDEDDDMDDDQGDDDDEASAVAGHNVGNEGSIAASVSTRDVDQDTGKEYRRPPGESLAVDDAENPLQLLARASYFTPSAEERSKRSPQKTRHDAATSSDAAAGAHVKLGDFFSITRSDLDIGDDIDPISLGLVEEDEAEMLFN